MRFVALPSPTYEFSRGTLKNWQRSLRGPCSPTAGFAHRRERIAMERRGPVKTQSFKMVRSGVSLVARESVLWISSVPLLHTRVAVRFGEDGRGGDRNAARVAFDQGLLLNQHVELQRVNEEIV